MLTVLFATRNRAALLREVLESYCLLVPPASGWKIVVVDNGSTDSTSQVLASFAARLPLHSTLEPTLGKNFALNTGLQYVEGDLTVFTDDDVFPSPHWLARLREVADTQASFSIFAGAVLPRWEIPPPDWITWIGDPGPVFTLTDTSLADGPVAAQLVFGPNMAIRSNIFESGVRFDCNIGPSGTEYPMGSETELVVRLCRDGHKAWYTTSSTVQHFIRKEQLTQEWVLQRATRWGRGRFRISPDQKLWFGVPRFLFRDLPKELALMALARMVFRRDLLFQARWRFNTLRGMAIEARKMSRGCSGAGKAAR
ncbi:MAG TPA: glycosyltransferase family 2 protein [Candidatus Acidoferrum sp.]|nr:glycosyltransferase family 2 protein [Candidatus Acidoferrum sp.]